MGPHHVRGRALHDPTGLHDDDAVGEAEGLGLVVGDVHDGGADAVEERGQLGDESVPEAPVERSERLVQQQQARCGGQRPGQRHPLLLAAGELGHGPAFPSGEADELEDLLHPSGPTLRVRALHAQPELDVLANVAVGEQGVVLEHEPDAPSVRRQVGHVGPADKDTTGTGALEAGHATQHGGLPAPRGTKQRHDLTGRHLERHVVDRRTFVTREADHEVANGERRSGGHQNSEAPAGRTRSMTNTTTTVTSIKMVARAMAWPNSNAPGRPRNR